jgi:hypothetical protein
MLELPFSNKTHNTLQVFLAAIAGYVPSVMVCCIASFMDACYIAHQNAITSPSLEHFRQCVHSFQELRNIFIATGVRTTISLPCQHALDHFYYAMQFFGSPNGLCSSITESKVYQGSKRAMASIKPIQGTHLDASDNCADGQDGCPIPDFFTTRDDARHNIILYGRHHGG